MGALAWVLGGAVSLARLLAARGEGAEACAVLAPAAAALAGHFEGPDLDEARAVLAGL
jgi:hypothetical protein